MPTPLVRQLNDALAKVLQQADFKDKLSAESVELMLMTPDQFAAHIRADIARWTALARERHLTLEA